MSRANALTFSVVSHGHGKMLDALLSDLNAQPSLAGARVVVTLNLRSDPFDATRYPMLRIVERRNAVPKGFGANHNAAFGHCDTPWFVVLNPDLRLCGPEPFTSLAQSASRIGRLGVIAPDIRGSDGGREDAVRANLSPWSLAARYALKRRSPPVDTEQSAIADPRSGRFFWLAGMCLMLDASAFRKVGGFDERFFLYCEDYDICARLFTAGYALAVDRTVRIVHDARRDSHRRLRYLSWHVAGLLRVWTSRSFWKIAAAHKAND